MTDKGLVGVTGTDFRPGVAGFDSPEVHSSPTSKEADMTTPTTNRQITESALKTAHRCAECIIPQYLGTLDGSATWVDNGVFWTRLQDALERVQAKGLASDDFVGAYHPDGSERWFRVFIDGVTMAIRSEDAR